MLWLNYPLLSAGSTQENMNMSLHHRKFVDWDEKHQDKQNQHLLGTCQNKYGINSPILVLEKMHL